MAGRSLTEVIRDEDHGLVKVEWSESPPDNTFHRFMGPTSGNGRAEAGYIIEAWGEYVDERPTSGPVVGPLEDGRWGRVDGARVHWQYDPPDACYLEGIRGADGRFRVDLVGEERCRNAAQAKRAKRGIEALRVFGLPGPHARLWTRESFLNELAGGLQKMDPKLRRNATLRDVLAETPELTQSHVYRLLDLFGLPGFPELKHWILGDAEGRLREVWSRRRRR